MGNPRLTVLNRYFRQGLVLATLSYNTFFMAGEPILIVDDTPVNLKLTRALLANQGYQVQTAASAEEAIEILDAHHPLLVLTDLQLPGMSGLELTRRIKSDDRFGDTIVVALSAFAGPREEEEARRAGCDGCLAKPIDTRTFAWQVREFLERRSSGSRSSSAMPPDALSESTLLPLRGRFLEESASQALQWVTQLEGELAAETAAQSVHQWIGAAGLLGYPEISEMARELETAFRARPVDAGELREALEELLEALAARLAERKPEV